jgi:hypothetical protein
MCMLTRPGSAAANRLANMIIRARLREPLAVDGVVVSDPTARTSVVRLSELAGGYARLLWRQAHAQLVTAKQSGWPAATPFLWGGAFRNRQIVHGLPGDGLALTFHFPAGVGDGVYAKLISKPGLAAIVTLDRELCRFMSIQFLNRGLAGLTAVPHQPNFEIGRSIAG